MIYFRGDTLYQTFSSYTIFNKISLEFYFFSLWFIFLFLSITTFEDKFRRGRLRTKKEVKIIEELKLQLVKNSFSPFYYNWFIFKSFTSIICSFKSKCN